MISTAYFKSKNISADFRSFTQFDNHEMVINFSDEAVGLKGAIAVHNTKLGPALGGTRMQQYSDQQAALQDVLSLSSAMSYKCALAGLPYGGGKAVITSVDGMVRQDVLKRYAEIVENLRGLFKTGTDVGITDDDVKHMARYTSHMLGVTEADRRGMSTSTMAALGVFYSCKAALMHLYGSKSLEGKTIGIKGLGKLGGELASLAYAEGAVIYAADIDTQKCANLVKLLPNIKIVACEDISSIALDIYAPCALGNEFNDKNVSNLKCKIISGGANNQLTEATVGNKLFARGILYSPDYVVNAGGLIYVADELEPGGFNKKRVLDRVSKIQKTLTDIFERSSSQNIPTHKVADSIAREQIG